MVAAADHADDGYLSVGFRQCAVVELVSGEGHWLLPGLAEQALERHVVIGRD